jgi:5-methylcytosine-specific restriction endonuclease McrA
MPQKISRGLAQARGLKRFFTGVPCQYGHISERLVSNKACYTCHLGRGAAWRERNHEYFERHNKAYYWANVEVERPRGLANQKRWHAENMEAVRQHRKHRRARKSGAIGSHTFAEIQALLVAQEGKCIGCQRDITGCYTEDHVIPLSRPGTSDDIENIQLMCSFCNDSKGTLTMAEWDARRFA